MELGFCSLGQMLQFDQFSGQARGDADNPLALQLDRQGKLLARNRQPANAQECARHSSCASGRLQHGKNGDPQ